MLKNENLSRELFPQIVEAFDPLLIRHGAEDFAIPDQILVIYDWGPKEMDGRGAGIRKTPENGALQTTSQNLLYCK